MRSGPRLVATLGPEKKRRFPRRAPLQRWMPASTALSLRGQLHSQPVETARKGICVGLALSVGLLADLKENDAEGYDMFCEYFDGVNRLLAAHSLPSHTEPQEAEPWSAQMYGYSGLHCLRRLAAYLDSGIDLPQPADRNSSQDPRLEAYFGDVTGQSSGWLKRLVHRPTFRREFDHLIVHSDAEGFYLPQDFRHVLFASGNAQIPGGMVGSTPRLLSECERLARVLEIPAHLTKDSEELWEAADSQGKGKAVWQRYGIESFTCVAMQAACKRSLETGAAIAFT